MKPVILVVDDEEAIRLFLEATLEDEGYEVLTASSGGQALEVLEHTVPDFVLLDLMLPDMSGLEVLKVYKERLPHVHVSMLTAYTETETTVKAMKLDAYEYISKPIPLPTLLRVVAQGLEDSAGARQRFLNIHQCDLFRGIEDIVPSQNPTMMEIYNLIRKISGGGTSTVLIEGESGVGKDVIATLLHRTSVRKDYPFLEINCAALPEALLESELFGHEKGAFTDAVTQKMGLLELTNSGTLFLDEIGEMAPTIQVKLLRVLEKMTFRRVGGLEDISVDVRIVAATNRRLKSEVHSGNFREDLYYRLNVVEIYVPPLRARPEDIIPLAKFFLKMYSKKFEKGFEGISEGASKALLDYHWPGNIRELRNQIERSVLLDSGPVLREENLHLLPEEYGSADLPTLLQEVLVNPLPGMGVNLEQLVKDFEEALVRKAFDASGGNQSRAARLLGLNRDKFRYRLKQYGIKEK
jgi:two-component system, NtrC family, response regulator AtoC